MRGYDHMSASSKKKLRKELEAVKLTEKQQTAQREAKKLNLYTKLFVAVMVAILAIAVTLMMAMSATTVSATLSVLSALRVFLFFFHLISS